jgi:hypothetical protein
MYSLALIIFVVSEKKVLTTRTIESKLPRNDHWKILYKVCVLYADRKSKMATTAIHRLTLNPMGKCSNEYNLHVNLLKTKVVIFRNRGNIKSEEKWYLNDNDSPCTSPILQLKKSEKLPSCFTLDFNLEYIDLIIFKSFPVTPHLASFNHNLIPDL